MYDLPFAVFFGAHSLFCDSQLLFAFRTCGPQFRNKSNSPSVTSASKRYNPQENVENMFARQFRAVRDRFNCHIHLQDQFIVKLVARAHHNNYFLFCTQYQYSKVAAMKSNGEQKKMMRISKQSTECKYQADVYYLKGSCISNSNEKFRAPEKVLVLFKLLNVQRTLE